MARLLLLFAQRLTASLSLHSNSSQTLNTTTLTSLSTIPTRVPLQSLLCCSNCCYVESSATGHECFCWLSSSMEARSETAVKATSSHTLTLRYSRSSINAKSEFFWESLSIRCDRAQSPSRPML
ncbi:hypothetical protein BDW67DRAFT_23090 [Aspergillus spinulosporus]